MLVCGVDDAGRGSMLGPLVIAGVTMQRSGMRRLKSLGVKDSKKLSPQRRESLYRDIIRIADGYHVSRISPKSIDRSVAGHNLNNLEAEHMARVISKLTPDVSYVDSCDVNPGRFGRRISRMSDHRKVRSHHHADSRFVIVAAASIVAKVTRDRAIHRLRSYGLGSGYPSDSRTVRFVRTYYKQNRDLPVFVRASWMPVKRIVRGG